MVHAVVESGRLPRYRTSTPASSSKRSRSHSNRPVNETTIGSYRCRFNPLRYEPHALGATRAQHRNNVDTFIFFMISDEKTILMMRAETIVVLQQERGHASALTASGPCCRIAPLTGQRRTMSVSAFPNLSWILLLPKLPDIQSQFLREGGIALSDSARTPSKPQKSAKPITPCSTRTDRKVLCAAGVQGLPVLIGRIGSAKTRLTVSRNAFARHPGNARAEKLRLLSR